MVVIRPTSVDVGIVGNETARATLYQIKCACTGSNSGIAPTDMISLSEGHIF